MPRARAPKLGEHTSEILSDLGYAPDDMKRMRQLACRLLLPAHGPPLPPRALDKLIEHRREREHKILEQVGVSGGELSAIARGAYADLPEVPPALTERQTMSHLRLLERHGRVRCEDAAGRRWSAT